MKKAKNVLPLLILCAVSIALGFFLGSRRSTASLSLVNSTIQKAASANQLSSYAPTEFPESGTAAVYLYGIDDVELQIGSGRFSFLSALSSGKLSSEDVVHQAFEDAAQGLCNRTEISRYGLSRYRFHYPNFELCITRDVFESAGGGRYPIFSIAFYLPGEGVSSELEQYLYAEDGTMVDTRAEDWGLQFSVEEAGADHIPLNEPSGIWYAPSMRKKSCGRNTRFRPVPRPTSPWIGKNCTAPFPAGTTSCT